MGMSYREVRHRLVDWLEAASSMDYLVRLNDRLAAVPAVDLLIKDLTAPAQQSQAAFTHDSEIGRLSYGAALEGSSESVTEPSAVRQLLRHTRRSLLWRLSNQLLFASVAETLFAQLQDDFPDGELSLSNIKDGAEGGQFQLWLPPEVAHDDEQGERGPPPTSGPSGSRTHAHARTQARTHARAHIGTHSRTHMHRHMHRHAHAQAQAHAQARTCTHAHAHMHMHMHTCTCRPRRPGGSYLGRTTDWPVHLPSGLHRS